METNSVDITTLSLFAEEEEEEEEVVVEHKGGEEEEEKEHIEMMKKRISSHPLYSVLLESHMACLKMSFGEMEEADSNTRTKAHTTTTIPTISELDNFKGAYCLALNELKEAMREPLRETTTFINAMHSQLEELI